ncbi:MAG: hypothetical protein WAX38_04175 [Minisyncoccia bacterium]
MSTVEYKESYGDCVACANSPVNHRLSYISQTINIWIGQIWFNVCAHPRLKNIGLVQRYSALYWDRVHYFLASLLGIVRYGTDVTRANSYRSQVIWEEARDRGITMEQVYVFKKPIDVYRAKLRNRWFHFESLPIPPELNQDGYQWFDDKHLLSLLLQASGIPTPHSKSLTHVKDVAPAMQELHPPCIVKPRIGSRGRHTTTYIRTIEEACSAFTTAQQLCRYVVLEEHLYGSVCRATVVGGKLAGFLKADPPHVIGDGSSTIAALVRKTNETRAPRVGEIIFTDEYIAYLQRQGYTSESVPACGVVVPITQRTGRLYGGETREMPDAIHPKLRTAIERAALLLAVPVVGFDLIIEHPEQDPDTQRWGIIEANSLPFIDLHYLPLFGVPSRVAKNVWDLWKND